jgi:hypothetical protein
VTLVWISDEDLAAPLDSAFREIVRAKVEAAPDPIAAFVEATRDRWIFGDAEWATETISMGLRALGRP